VAEERDEEERDAPVFDFEVAPFALAPVDREPDFAVDDRRVVVAIAIVR
jgi:hypothetical protein